MNRNKLITLFISNLTIAIVHKILEKAIENQDITEKYNKEIKNSWEIAKNYRNKINPIDKSLPIKDISEIKSKIIAKIKNELNLRIEKGYTNIDMSLVEKFVDESLKELGII